MRVSAALFAASCGVGCSLLIGLDGLEYDTPTVPDSEAPAPTPDAADAAGDVGVEPRFDDPARWSAYDPDAGAASFTAGPYDGRYVYFVAIPDNNNFTPRVLRLDTGAPFDNPSSWAIANPAPLTDLSRNYGFSFDGRYLVLAGFRKLDAAAGASSIFLRFDTTRPEDFATAGAWESIDLSTLAPVPPPTIGLYTSGAHLDSGTYYGSVSVQGAFLRHNDDDLDAGWTAYSPDTGCHTVQGAACTGTSLFFGPANAFQNGDCVIRFDRTKPFTFATAWDAVELMSLGPFYNGFLGTVSTATHVYLTQAAQPGVPAPDASVTDGHFRIARHAASGPLDSGWEFMIVDSISNLATGYAGGVFDGRFIYFAPFPRPVGGRILGTVYLRYDTTLPFNEKTSWQAVPAQLVGLPTVNTIYQGATFDGQYVYYGPRNPGVPATRYRARDTKSPPPVRCSSF